MTRDLGALAPIVERKLRDAETLRCASAALWTKAESLPPARGLQTALCGGTVIAEMKRRSPSGGELRPDLDCGSLAIDYASAGAAAVSVLTDGPSFGGSLEDLAHVRDAVDLPLLRKDFTVDPVQVAEARVAGADWVLLIVTLFEGGLLDECLDAVERAHAHAIVEVHDEDETARAVAAGAECIGINNRDLRTLRCDVAVFARLRRMVPDDVVCVAESGIRDTDTAGRLVGEGADAVLVGEALMRASSPADACAAMVAAAREAVRQ